MPATTTSIVPGRYSDEGEVRVTSLGSRTTVGNTIGVLVNSRNITLQAQVATIGTNVVVQALGSLDGVNYFNIGSSATYTANGYYAINVTAPVKYIAARLVSISTGTPTVTFSVAY